MSNKEYYLEKELFEARDRLRAYEHRDRLRAHENFDSEGRIERRYANADRILRICRDAYLLCAALVLILFAIKMIDPTTQLVSSIADRNFAEARGADIQAIGFASNTDVSRATTPEQSLTTDTDQITSEEIVYKEFERSWLHRAFFNWILPALLVLGSAYAVVLGILLLYERFGSAFASDRRTTFSAASAGTSTAGMVFAAIRYKAELLEHEVGSYLFLSSLFALIFFILLLSTSNKILSGLVYIMCMTSVVLVSKYTTDNFGTPISEYRSFLSSLAIPYQTIVVLGTIFPVVLVVFATIQGTRLANRGG